MARSRSSRHSEPATRTGTGEHAEYYTDDQKVILTGGAAEAGGAKLSGKQDITEGDELTYFANDDRLLVKWVRRRKPGAEPCIRENANSAVHEQTRDQGNLQDLSRPPGGGRCLGVRAAGRSGRAAGPERRGQDHLVLHDRGADQPGFRARAGGRRGYHRPAHVPARAGAASATCRRKPRSSAS